MRVHHLNCISTCPAGGLLMDGRSAAELRGRLTCHCLLVETDRDLVLIDTGFGTRDCLAPRTRLSKFFLALLKPDFRLEMTAVRQIEALGYRAGDVRHIVLSHLDFDHAGGLDDFPDATVHMLGAERDSATAQATVLDRMRYRPQQWSTQKNWRVYGAAAGDPWFGFERVRELDGVGPGIVMVPLLGHTHGHAGVAVRLGSKWLFYAADAYFYHREMKLDKPRCTPGLAFYQWMMEKQRSARLQNQIRLRQLKRSHGGEVQIFCAHDVTEFEALAAHRFDRPLDIFAQAQLTHTHPPH